MRVDSEFGPVDVPAVLRADAGTPKADRAPILNLRDCEHHLTRLTPGMARRALIEGEHVDPRVADTLVQGFAFFTPCLMIHGERGAMLAAAPTLRRVRSAELYASDMGAALVGEVYGMPRVLLAIFPDTNAAQTELAEMIEPWGGRLLVVLVSGGRTDGSIEQGTILAAHEIVVK